MVDHLAALETSVENGTGGVAVPQGRVMTFLATRAGRGLLMGIAALLLVVIASTVVLLAMTVLDNSATVPPIETAVKPGAAAPATSAPSPTAEPEVPPTPAVRVPNTEVFTFRDPFKPIPLPKKAVEASSSTSTSSGPVLDPNTLYLDDIITENGTPKARLLLGGNTYTLAEGEELVTGPGESVYWRVLHIRSSSVVMLFGDEQVILTAGVGVSK